MVHLTRIRKGWENENLARYILSKFSFVAQPTSIGDDIGIDFFCTLINREDPKFIFPKNAFAIQIKSNISPIDITNKIKYLESLEIPFFIGVMEQKNLKLTLYSGEYIPYFFSLKGIPVKLSIEPCDAILSGQECYIDKGSEGYILKFPRVSEITAFYDEENIKETVKLLYSTCSITQYNINTRKMQEYIFRSPRDDSEIKILAGSGSNKVFRNNFIYRLCEVFYNLEWMHNNNMLIIEELKCYEKIYKAIEEFYSKTHGFNGINNFENLKKLYNSLKNKLNQ